MRRLTAWRHVLCCAPSYLDAHPAPQTPADLADHNCLRFAYYPFGDDWHFIDHAGKPVSVRVAGNLVSTSADMLRSAALAGAGLFLAPPFVAAEELASEALVALMPDYRTVEFEIAAIYPHRRYVTAKLRGFIDALVERFADERRWLNPAR
jgi:DNA-binding transcriptional LysR family regulator